LGLRDGHKRRVGLLLGAMGGLASLVAVQIWPFVAGIGSKPEYDEASPDHKQFSRIFERIRGLDLVSSSASDWTIDFSELANGQWKTVCVLGGYTDPIKMAEESGWKIAKIDRDRLEVARHAGFRLAIVEEFELLIAYADPQNNARFLHLRRGIGAPGQHLEACVSKPETRLALDAVRREWAGQ
jgi:hypothetical protein